MTAHVKDAGTWKQLTEIHVKDAGTWKSVTEAYVKDGGTWKKFFPSIAASISDRTVSSTAADPASASTLVRFSNNGQLYGPTSSNSLEFWKDEGANSDFDIRATKISGTTPTGTFGNWLNLGTTRDWTLGRTGIGTNECVIDFEIRDTTTGTVLTTGRITMRAEVISGV